MFKHQRLGTNEQGKPLGASTPKLLAKWGQSTHGAKAALGRADTIFHGKVDEGVIGHNAIVFDKQGVMFK